ncbi:MAG TPA: potassium channel family protein [Solirubrobacterales bacterium]|nr:potassium channel family protein [Solirubrobacterales bacterium]
MRLLRLLRLLRLAQLSRDVFSLEGVRYAALLAILTAVGGAALFDAFEQRQDLDFWDDTYWAITTMTTLGSDIQPSTTGGEIVSVVVLLVGISFVALLTGSFAQRFLAPEIAEIEEELEAEQLSAEALALRELHSVQQQIQALEVAIERMAKR